MDRFETGNMPRAVKLSTPEELQREEEKATQRGLRDAWAHRTKALQAGGLGDSQGVARDQTQVTQASRVNKGRQPNTGNKKRGER